MRMPSLTAMLGSRAISLGLSIFLLSGAIALSVNQSAHADINDRSDILGRSVRVLLSGVSSQLVQEVRQIDPEERIEFSYPSQNLSDFDLWIILVDEYEDVFDINPFPKLGVDPSILPKQGEYPPMVNVRVEFAGDDIKFPIYIIDRRFFFARDRACHAKLLRDLITQPNPKIVLDQEKGYLSDLECPK